MKNLIERYVYDVVRRLPEKEQEEVRQELNANIYDMLPDNAGEEEIKEILLQLGAPAILAEKYRQKPRYLISPAVYDDYVRVLKLVLPIVGSLLFAIGMILGSLNTLQGGMLELSKTIAKALASGFSMGISATIQTLVWITVGFVIAERAGDLDQVRQKAWSLQDLPDTLPSDKGTIRLSDSVTALVMTLVFSILALMVCTGRFPLAFALHHGDIQVYSLFSPSFLASCIPVILIITFFSLCESVVKIKQRRWTPLVCGAVIVSSLISMGALLYLIQRPDVFSSEFVSFLQDGAWSELTSLPSIGLFKLNLGLKITSVIIVLIAILECAHAIWKTFKIKI